MYMADEEERKYLKAENDKTYQHEMEAENANPDEIFSVQAFVDFIKAWKCN